ncbi:hypothetical protein PENTCL1PPCAC_15891 [Pristionchus entomophagus]|uniref:Uncharacterized protein n=1 Tax=Pristionchus entomophagus TaxID=358040 RepID=A0AAV5THB7_9BILA|nr:hypothetical protein PENTCL1PPCAC_15891 [Pristionchus entomophagus]
MTTKLKASGSTQTWYPSGRGRGRRDPEETDDGWEWDRANHSWTLLLLVGCWTPVAAARASKAAPSHGASTHHRLSSSVSCCSCVGCTPCALIDATLCIVITTSGSSGSSFIYNESSSSVITSAGAGGAALS